ncbi:MAG: flagellar biosynthesis regulator FlaF [Pseudomonadota bacterium]
MYATHLAQAAYAQPASPVRTDRGTEHAAFERVTALLARANAPGAAFALRADAVHRNRQLWTALAADALDPGNALPDGLRAQIVYLQEFTARQSRAALNGGDLGALIDINTAVMRGLRGEASTR